MAISKLQVMVGVKEWDYRWAELCLQDDMERNEDPNQYVVHDPLLEKGKEKFNKEQAKFKKRNREWAGKSLT